VQAAALWQADPLSKESDCVKDQKTEKKSGQGPTKGCRAIEGRTDGWKDR
jgi:hypothetical protein